MSHKIGIVKASNQTKPSQPIVKETSTPLESLLDELGAEAQREHDEGRVEEEELALVRREEVAGELAVAVLDLQRHARDDVRERDTPKERWQCRTEEDHPVKRGLPASRFSLAAVFECDTSCD